jgi:cellobiose-specific phosphotransferase system component IIC
MEEEKAPGSNSVSSYSWGAPMTLNAAICGARKRNKHLIQDSNILISSQAYVPYLATLPKSMFKVKSRVSEDPEPRFVG